MGAEPQSVFDPDGREVAFDAGSHLHLALSRPLMLETMMASETSARLGPNKALATA